MMTGMDHDAEDSDLGMTEAEFDALYEGGEDVDVVAVADNSFVLTVSTTSVDSVVEINHFPSANQFAPNNGIKVLVS